MDFRTSGLWFYENLNESGRPDALKSLISKPKPNGPPIAFFVIASDA